jgi:predicted nucleic acid-binding protein
VLKEPNELDSWYKIDHGVTSELTIVECRRTLYRANASGRLSDSGFQLARNYADQILLRLTIVNITSELVEKAAGPLPSALATLDAIHLVSAMDYRRRLDKDEPPLSFGTHDHELAVAATLSNFPVLGTVLGA